MIQKPIDDFKDYIVEDVLGHIEGITAKRMFGGYSLYLDGKIFAMITSDTDLYFKVDDTNRSEYEARGSHPFVYSGWKDPKRKPITMPYWHISEEIMEDHEKIEELVRDSARISQGFA